ncbi:MAG: MaoC family dehydratase [Alphaproteobacteria bacterium]|nr:MaoC family dehydratase [Alphaproteobacteria bacterium]
MGELHGFYLEDLTVGMTALYARTINAADITLFAGVSGDINPMHLNHEFASGTMFEGCIAHGMLTASLISTVLGTKLPGPGCIYLSQNLQFKAPVRAGDTVRARATITEIVNERRRVTLKTVCTVGDKVVVEGEAIVMVPTRASLKAPASAEPKERLRAAGD